VAGKSAGLAEYLKRGFLHRWNMLLFGGVATASLLSPWPDASIALVVAAELIYLTQLVSSTRFRQAIDSVVYHEKKQAAAVTGNRTVQDLVSGLSNPSKARFESLRARCIEMRTIAHGVRGSTGDQAGEELSTSALDRLLWVFLRLLVSQESLHRFLERTNVSEIQARLGELRTQLEAQQHSNDERIARSLADSVAAQETRLENYEKAQKNAEFVRFELDRIEAKIQALTEAAVNRQDPDFLTGQIDSVTESMHSTEKAISELQQITGLVDEMQEPPSIIEADFRKVVQR
jgi:hypothetical protein